MHSLDFGLYPTNEGHLPGHTNMDSQEIWDSLVHTYKHSEKQQILYHIHIDLGKKVN